LINCCLRNTGVRALFPRRALAAVAGRSALQQVARQATAVCSTHPGASPGITGFCAPGTTCALAAARNSRTALSRLSPSI